MPYANVKITREGGTTAGQKSRIIRGVTEVLVDVLGKSPATTFVVIDEVDMENWGVGGLPVEEYRDQVTPRGGGRRAGP
jgi:4-oxalocrotonate tautomerase